MPTEHPFRVIVVDDDFMIVRLHQKMIESTPGFTVVGTATNGEQALTQIEQQRPDLIVLDVYLPDQSGIELLTEIRSRKQSCDVILITAARELDVVQEGFRLGVFDYLIKPFTIDRLRISLKKYADFRLQVARSTAIDQGVVDHLNRARNASLSVGPLNESGVDARTLERIKNCLAQADGGQSAEDVAKLAGVSRSTARTYLDFLVAKGMAEEQLVYGTVGRPRRLFRMFLT